MKMMRYVFIILIFLVLLLNSCSNKPQNSDLIADCGPLELNSYEDISKAKQKIDQIDDLYNLSALEFYYIPASSLLKGNLYKIHIKDRYVCLYYSVSKIDQSQFKDEKDRILNTIKLEWTRNEDGVELLKNTIEQQNLKQLDKEGLYYYMDITYPDAPDIVLSKSIHWVQDGYEFNLDVPIDIFDKIKSSGSESVWTNNLTLQKIKIDE